MQAMHTQASPACLQPVREESKCGQLSMGSSYGWHLIFPISLASLPPVREAGSYRLPALKQGKIKLALFPPG
jgi:hypothetical protein